MRERDKGHHHGKDVTRREKRQREDREGKKAKKQSKWKQTGASGGNVISIEDQVGRKAPANLKQETPASISQIWKLRASEGAVQRQEV